MELTIPCNHLCMLEIIPVADETETYMGFDPEEFHTFASSYELG